MPKPKKILKILGGLIVFFTLPTLLFFAFMYFKYNEDLPTGEQGEAADALAVKMLNALDHKAYEATDYIEFTFKQRHHFKWDKAQNTCEVYWKHVKVDLDLNNTYNSEVFISDIKYDGIEKQDYIEKALNYFNNDTFWLVAPYKVFDKGVERRLVTTEEGKQALLVTYTTGGSTPGDSYLWHLDDNGKPRSYQMWVDILPIDGFEASWSDWTTTETGAQLPTFHKLLVLGLEIEDIKTSSSNFSQTNTDCESINVVNEDPELAEFPKIIKTCSFGKYVSITTGNASYQGKYYYDYNLFIRIKDSLIPINNSDMFIRDISHLEGLINNESVAYYENLRKIPELKECSAMIEMKYHPIDSMAISFEADNKISFHIDYGLPSACDNINESVHTFPLEEIESVFLIEAFYN